MQNVLSDRKEWKIQKVDFSLFLSKNDDKEGGLKMRKLLSVFLLGLLLVSLLGIGAVMAKPLDKASPILAGQFNNSHLFEDNYLEENQVILWTPSNDIGGKKVETVAWAIPSDISSKKVSSNDELPEPHQKELEAVGVVIMDELSICQNVKTVLYSAPIETNKRIGIFSASEDLDIDTIKESIKEALLSETDEDEKLLSKSTKVVAW